MNPNIGKKKKNPWAEKNSEVHRSQHGKSADASDGPTVPWNFDLLRRTYT